MRAKGMGLSVWRNAPFCPLPPPLSPSRFIFGPLNRIQILRRISNAFAAKTVCDWVHCTIADSRTTADCSGRESGAPADTGGRRLLIRLKTIRVSRLFQTIFETIAKRYQLLPAPNSAIAY